MGHGLRIDTLSTSHAERVGRPAAYISMRRQYLSERRIAVEEGGALAQMELIQNIDIRPLWYVIYTLPRHEKVVADRLLDQGVETYLPLYCSVRDWNRRRVEVELPLFPGYVFVKMIITNRIRVLTQPGVVRLVSSNGSATALPDGEVERLQSSLAVWKAEPYPFLAAGKQVLIKSGPFAGLVGRIIRRKGKMRLIVSLDFIQRAVQLEMDAAEAQLAS